MLKRYQILLNDWQADYLKFVSENYDISFSESIRVLVCVAALHSIAEIFPEYKPKVTIKNVAKKIRKMQGGKLNEEEFHKMMSGLYFESRKAMEFRMNLSKKKKK